MPFVYRWSYPLLSCSPGRLGRTVMPRHFVRPLPSAPALPLDLGSVTLALEDELACLLGIDATSEHEQQPASGSYAVRTGIVVRCSSCSEVSHVAPSERSPSPAHGG